MNPGEQKIVKVLVVEDLPVIQAFLTYILCSDPNIKLIGTANNGEEACEFVKHNRPDVITMDIHMPKMNGFEATLKIMETYPTPIIIVSGSSTTHEVSTTFKAIEAGALTVVPRPQGIGHPDYETTANELIHTLKSMSEVKVIRRWPKLKKEIPAPPVLETHLKIPLNEIQIIAIGSSTGGPIAIQTILSGLTNDFPLPILVVQHIANGFTEGFVEWLAQTTGFKIHTAKDGEYILPGHVYVAPDGFHMGLKTYNRINLGGDDPENGHKPSVSYLFRSVSKVYGKNSIGVLLTGMGKDGSAELKMMKDSGAVTFAQDEESSVVFGMPGEAIKIDAADYILPPEKIAAMLKNLLKINQEK